MVATGGMSTGKLPMDSHFYKVEFDKCKADRERLAAELDMNKRWLKEMTEDSFAKITALDSELADAQRQVEFWRSKAEARGNEIKRLYILEAALKAELDEYDRDKEAK